MRIRPRTIGTFSGFADDAEIVDGYIALNDDPGIGFERQRELYKIMADLAAD